MVTAQPTPGRHVHRRGHRARRMWTAPTAGSRRATPVADVQVRAARRRATRPAPCCAARAAPPDTVAELRAASPGRRPAGDLHAAERRPLAHRAGDAHAARRARPPCSSVSRGARSPADAASVGTVTGWTADTLAGPAFRLVTTVIATAPVAARHRRRSASKRRGPGRGRAPDLLPGRQRPALRAHRRDRPVAPSGRWPSCTSPDGMPFRDEGARTAGLRPAVRRVRGRLPRRDQRRLRGGRRGAAHPGASPPRSSVSQSPLVLRAARAGRVGSRRASPTSPRAPVDAEFGMHLGGAARIENVPGDGLGEVQRIPFVVPAWSRGVVVDITMDRAQWGRFTDFGVTPVRLARPPARQAAAQLCLRPPAGRAARGPRRHARDARPLPRLRRCRAATSGGACAPRSGSTPTPRSCWRALGQRARHRRRARAPPRRLHAAGRPWPLGAGFVPLGLLVARADGRSWTREIELAPPGTALVP